MQITCKTHVMKEPTRLPDENDKRRYWRANLRWLAGLLAVWFAASYGCGILLADWLDQFRLPGTQMKLGFWFSQQGSIYVFVLLIAVYARVMNRLDRELLQGTSAQGGESS
jgi:putative solute:sodium symporter small subunit